MKNIVSGKAIKGKKRGKQLGFPTVNIELNVKVAGGVYAGLVNINGRKYKAGVFINPEKKLLEAHLIGFSGDLYGREIELEIGKRIRDVMKFGSDEELKRQIKMDIEMICSRG